MLTVNGIKDISPQLIGYLERQENRPENCRSSLLIAGNDYIENEGLMVVAVFGETETVGDPPYTCSRIGRSADWCRQVWDSRNLPFESHICNGYMHIAVAKVINQLLWEQLEVMECVSVFEATFDDTGYFFLAIRNSDMDLVAGRITANHSTIISTIEYASRNLVR